LKAGNEFCLASRLPLIYSLGMHDDLLDASESETARSSQVQNPYVHAIWASVVICVIIVAFLAYRFSVNKVEKNAGDLVRGATTKAELYARKLADVMEEIAERFKTGKITETFTAEIPVFQSAGIGRLQLGTSTATETFQKSDIVKIIGISLGETVSEIHVPVTYRYHLVLAEPWKLSVQGQTCIVVAPQIRASLPPAIHTESMQKKTSSGWARFDKQDQLDNLERSITPTLASYASNPAHLAKVREECRLTVARFVRAWLLKEDQWRTDRFHSVVVLFADETIQPGQAKPTITYESKL
jgi:hypothetical protein